MLEKEYPLSGLTVIDFSTVVAGPSAARVLADLGADVIKVESKNGDPTRFQDATPTLKPESYCFTNCNSNKKFISINIKSEGGKDAMLRLVEKSDVFITNVRYKSLKRAGLDYEALKDKFPKLIYAHFNGYGYKGPDSDLPGYDMSAFWSRSGAMLDGHIDDSKRLYEPAYGMGDLFCAGYFATGILSALIGREKTGHGTMVSTSLLHSGVWANGRNIMPAQDAIGDVVPLPPEWNYNMFYRAYLCADGKWLTLAFNYLQHFKLACEVFEMEDLLNDPRYQTQGALRVNEVAKSMTDRLEATIAGKPRDYWIEQMRARDLVYAPVQAAAEVSKDAQVLENGFLEEVEYGNGTKVLMPNIPIQYSDYEVRKVVPAEGIGANTQEILQDLGYTDEKIRLLMEEGCIQ